MGRVALAITTKLRYAIHMKLLLKRFLWISENRPTNPFIPMFVIMNFLAGAMIIGIHLLPLLPELILFEIFNQFLGISWAGIIWGGGMILSSILHMFEIYYRNGKFGAFGAWASLILWSYIMGAYAAELFLFAAVLVTPFVLFWGWYLVRWKKYSRQLRDDTFPQIH